MDEVEAKDLTIDALINRVEAEGTKEVILAFKPKLEGKITAMHIVSLIKPIGVKIFQIA